MENNFPYFVMIVYTDPHYSLKNFSFSVRIGTSMLFFYGLYQGIMTFLAKDRILMQKLHLGIIS
ncbi:hypothetical protein PL11201_660073 [Planktothrix sp. PCC 11201]|nr:hypothetical protein PL11201_660073 [Planktothrix sp. PCC 11201]